VRVSKHIYYKCMYLYWTLVLIPTVSFDIIALTVTTYIHL
jgi:hypothetical protein